ncbi:GNAT family N-acetyltransferase [Paraglaciecola aquimarina]|uniref:GNAT family N-acetyltransferase n=1 Tax=Paraglaciecola aquimarina TaxID=1235557 RepID=A0ABU3STB5_9ALTE|nr:GNAT family N-acetyltransferase [Paraglaciecola aquimarina]MDU0353252.1 GNAT family N-acetyltransferase [Paraglaciecola aquimarina]
MFIRRAKADDADTLAKLIYDSAPQLLSAFFTLNSTFQVRNFLRTSLVCRDGQYGYHNHWVVEQNCQVVGCVSAWHCELSESFHRASLTSISQFYGLENALLVLQNNHVLQDCTSQPKVNEWCIGHLSVAPQNKRQGVASVLLEQMTCLALEKNKSVICLDVEASNIQAIAFYTALGFVIESETGVTLGMAKLGLGAHLHLSKAISS